jgi:hypothetical protein
VPVPPLSASFIIPKLSDSLGKTQFVVYWMPDQVRHDKGIIIFILQNNLESMNPDKLFPVDLDARFQPLRLINLSGDYWIIIKA